jgi:Na+-transporting methylmalonyl-CoA/oxaloacetate decarboxylase gamma subunit
MQVAFMPTSTSSTPALPVAYVVLRILIVLNWLMGAAILTLLLISPNEQWIMSAFKLSPSPEADRLVMGLRLVAVLGLVAIPLNNAALQRLLAMVETVRLGDPFVAANARRLDTIARVLLALQLLSVVIGAIGKTISSPAHPVDLDAGFSITGWLAVLLTFLLARVFAEGARMRDDLAGTV